MTNLPNPWIVNRRISMVKLMSATDIGKIKLALSKLAGIQTIIIQGSSYTISINYDASLINYKTIINALTSIDKQPLNNWWHHFKMFWYEYTDDNAKHNANAPASACCSKPRRRI